MESEIELQTEQTKLQEGNCLTKYNALDFNHVCPDTLKTYGCVPNVACLQTQDLRIH